MTYFNFDGFHTRGQSYKANVVINDIKNGFNKLNFTLNYINLMLIIPKKFYGIDPRYDIEEL